MKYFSNLGTLTTNNIQYRNLFEKLEIQTPLTDNLLEYYRINDGESLAHISYKLYGKTDYWWLIAIINDIKDVYYDIPLTDSAIMKKTLDDTLQYIRVDKDAYISTELSIGKTITQLTDNGIVSGIITEKEIQFLDSEYITDDDFIPYNDYSDNFINYDNWSTVSGWANTGELSIIVDPEDSNNSLFKIGNNDGSDMIGIVNNNKIYFDKDTFYRFTVRVKDIGSGQIYLGVMGYRNDGITYNNFYGMPAVGSQHYVVNGGILTDDTWFTLKGYIRGISPKTVYNSRSLASPSTLHYSTKYISPYIICNYPNTTGTTFIDYFNVDYIPPNYYLKMRLIDTSKQFDITVDENTKLITNTDNYDSLPLVVSNNIISTSSRTQLTYDRSNNYDDNHTLNNSKRLIKVIKRQHIGNVTSNIGKQ